MGSWHPPRRWPSTHSARRGTPASKGYASPLRMTTGLSLDNLNSWLCDSRWSRKIKKQPTGRWRLLGENLKYKENLKESNNYVTVTFDLIWHGTIEPWFSCLRGENYPRRRRRLGKVGNISIAYIILVISIVLVLVHQPTHKFLL